MNLQFKKMKPKKSYQHVVEEIQTAIVNGDLDSGERLPPEMKLKEMFDTSRGTVREALRVLEQKGLVSIRTGVKGGAVVKEANAEAMTDSIGIMIRHQGVSLDHLAEFRKLMEGYVAREAARTAGKGDVRRLRSILSQIKDLVNTRPSGWEKFHILDARFHRELARIAANPLIETNLTAIHENIETYFHEYLPFSRALLEEDCKDLEEIVRAVEDKNERRAEEIARRHVSRFSSLMEKNLENREDKNLPGKKTGSRG
ncbi:FadR/GntR family transcriptional regulator [Desulfospira joergensenii]|uniref:FadR/GntR family transcriptional regulator n=1 Tax=Desulfospira joergensenii TaxID=53329 RepID=UPI0003B6205D|nr:FCD domain-containing protein [Desulfospira joergensenii]